MKIYNKQGILYYAQADHLSGEEIGSAIHALYDAGACNVQVISTITKKNRPGFIVLADARPEKAANVETALISELRVTGWHVIETTHRHLEVEYLSRQVQFHICEKRFEVFLEVKKSYGDTVELRPERRSIEALRKTLGENGIRISADRCSRIIAEIEEKNLNEYTLEETV